MKCVFRKLPVESVGRKTRVFLIYCSLFLVLYSLKYRLIPLKLCGLVNRSGKRAICEGVNDMGGKLFQVKFVALTKFLVLSIFLREQLKERR